jgi:hypothetical protein
LASQYTGKFGQFAERNRKRRGEGKPETCTFLGFTHYCGKRKSDRSFIVWRETAKKRMVAKLNAIKAELVRGKHDPSAQVGEWLQKVVQGLLQTMPFRATKPGWVCSDIVCAGCGAPF